MKLNMRNVVFRVIVLQIMTKAFRVYSSVVKKESDICD